MCSWNQGSENNKHNTRNMFYKIETFGYRLLTWILLYLPSTFWELAHTFITGFRQEQMVGRNCRRWEKSVLSKVSCLSRLIRWSAWKCFNCIRFLLKCSPIYIVLIDLNYFVYMVLYWIICIYISSTGLTAFHFSQSPYKERKLLSIIAELNPLWYSISYL